MKYLAIIGILILGLVFLNCKNDKTEKKVVIPEEIEKTESKDLETEKDIDSLIKIEEVINHDTSIEEVKEDSKINVEQSNNTKEELEKPSKELVIEINEETKTKDVIVDEITEDIVETEKEVLEEEVLETSEEIKEEIVSETSTETNPVKETPKETQKEEPVVTEIPKEVPTASDKWVVPSKYRSLVNPEEASKENIAIGKSLYSKHCKSCHGKEGYGDGSKADEVEGDLGDFSTSEFQAQSDGAVFYKSYIGRDDMPNYEKKMSVEDAWLVVYYVRTLEE